MSKIEIIFLIIGFLILSFLIITRNKNKGLMYAILSGPLSLVLFYLKRKNKK